MNPCFSIAWPLSLAVLLLIVLLGLIFECKDRIKAEAELEELKCKLRELL